MGGYKRGTFSITSIYILITKKENDKGIEEKPLVTKGKK